MACFILDCVAYPRYTVVARLRAQISFYTSSPLVMVGDPRQSATQFLTYATLSPSYFHSIEAMDFGVPASIDTTIWTIAQALEAGPRLLKPV